jgi:Ca2+-binding RTX toxin-like protein
VGSADLAAFFPFNKRLVVMTHKTSSAQSVLKSLWSDVDYTSQSDYYTTYKAPRDAFKQSSLLLSGQAQQLRETLSKAFNADSPADIDLSLSMKPWTMPNANGDGGSPADDAVASAFKGQKGQSLAKVLAPSATINGLSQAQLGDEWWKTIYSIPLDQHFGVVDDATDPRGRRGSAEKALEARFDRSTLFIGGAFGEISNRDPGEAVEINRTIVLPNNGKVTAFLPLLNGSLDNIIENPGPDLGNKSVQELMDDIKALFNTTKDDGLVSSLFASVDGMDVGNLLDYRQASGAAFEYTTPFPLENSLISSFGITGDWYLDNDQQDSIKLKDLAVGNSLTISPAVSDGYWLAVEVAGGSHTLNFGGSLGDEKEPFFDLDVTYNLLNSIAGSNQGDDLKGTAANDYLDGSNGKDIITGCAGDDLLIGGNGKDVLDGGIGSDELWGDSGTDVFIFKKGYGLDTIFDFSRGERVETQLDSMMPTMKDIALPAGLSAQLDFGNGDLLTFVGVQSSNLSIQPGMITLI